MTSPKFLTATLINDNLVTNAADVLVPWWSFTKTVLATTVLKLASDGRLDLDQPYRDRPFTIRQLLQHTAGVTDYGHLPSYQAAVAAAELPWSRAKLLIEANAAELIYPPGQGWRYSNIGYLFVRQLIEEHLACSLQDALQQIVFHPLGLTDLFVAQERADLDRLVWGNERLYHPDWVYHGLLVGTPSAAVRLLHHIMMGEIIDPAHLDQMLVPYRVGPPMRHWVEPSCGLGLMIDTASPHGFMCGHTGGGPGSGCAIYHFPDLSHHPTIAVFASDLHDGDVEGEALRLATLP